MLQPHSERVIRCSNYSIVTSLEEPAISDLQLHLGQLVGNTRPRFISDTLGALRTRTTHGMSFGVSKTERYLGILGAIHELNLHLRCGKSLRALTAGSYRNIMTVVKKRRLALASPHTYGGSGRRRNVGYSGSNISRLFYQSLMLASVTSCREWFRTIVRPPVHCCSPTSRPGSCSRIITDARPRERVIRCLPIGESPI